MGVTWADSEAGAVPETLLEGSGRPVAFDGVDAESSIYGGKAASEAVTAVTTDEELEETRHGNWLTAIGHIITAVIGAGVLSLSYSIGVLGWLGGIFTMILFALITWYTSALLADVYVINGKRQRSYMDAVRTSMGEHHATIIAWVQYLNLFLTAVAYNITGATSLQLVVCPAGNDDCSIKYWSFAVMFAGAQLVVSQVPNLDSLVWISAVGALMSFCYSTIAMVLSIVYMAEYGADGGSLGGIEMSTTGKVYGIFNAVGAIVFAYSFSFILIEIAETLKTDGKGPVWHMKRAVNVSLVIITFFYLAVGSMGYAAFGNNTCGDIVTCFAYAPDGITKSIIPDWVIRMVNVMVVIHLVPAYAVFSQPLFAFVEQKARHGRLHHCLPHSLTRWTFRLIFRSTYVVIVGFIAICMPFFSDVVGLIGAIGFWPATVFYPVEMYIRKHNIKGGFWWWLEAINAFCFIATILAIIGSVQLIVTDAKDYKFFE